MGMLSSKAESEQQVWVNVYGALLSEYGKMWALLESVKVLKPCIV